MMQNKSVQRASEDGSIGATGALATPLGSAAFHLQNNANPLESAGPPSTGIPLVSTNKELLPEVEGSVPTTPDQSVNHAGQALR